ncbi:MAG: hypothetical protein OEZ01_11460 [Candidatus Heimdallarchaeota archaeon]|nr:hypothetical protein [Candidatus Heimdallarchaeota archaeon]MDH5646619.1 hypothetical protein [Candidatus Heimdallarchaeota archaeon]
MTEYEFNNEENEQFKILATNLLYTAIGLGVIGLSMLIRYFASGDLANVIPLFTAIVNFGIAGTVYLPVVHLNNIIQTEGNDIKELMAALRKWSYFWTFTVVVLGINVIILIMYLLKAV